MARKPRIHYPGAWYHVILRGNGGSDIFFDTQDRTQFFLLLQEGVERYGHRIHAYCLMTNHIHLVVQVANIPLSRITQNISFRYTRYINRRKNQAGHLFQGRYKALLIDAENYLKSGVAPNPDPMWSSTSTRLMTATATLRVSCLTDSPSVIALSYVVIWCVALRARTFQIQTFYSGSHGVTLH